VGASGFTTSDRPSRQMRNLRIAEGKHREGNPDNTTAPHQISRREIGAHSYVHELSYGYSMNDHITYCYIA
jgi:hypothetical protein